MNDIHTVFGAGQVGVQLARVLAGEGHTVRLVRRGAAGPAIEGVTWMQADASDPVSADAACQGAKVVYNCANPADYHRWDGVLQPLMRGVLQAAGRAGARLVQLDNLYMYGRPPASPFDERTPMQPCSKKGELRKAMVDELFEAHARGEVAVTSGRASDYFGPDTPNAAVLRPDVYDRIVRGASVYMTGNPDMPHSYSYTPDVARGLAVLGQHEAAVGRAWHLPVAAQLTTRQLIDRFAARAGTTVKTRRVPQWVLRTIGVVSPLVHAMVEMTYQWDVPYLLDDGDFRRVFGVGPTDLDTAIDTTLSAHRASKAA
jgi:nucleoside-diphosphate-sugar epimerase